MMSGYFGYMIIAGIISVVGMIVSGKLKEKFQKYSQIPLRAGLSGREVARQMLEYYGISDVKIVRGQGFLTDHYNPLTKTVTLSPQIYDGRTIMAAAVAAHECGHAVQHATAYQWLQMRSAIVPVVKFASYAQQVLLFMALGMFSSNPTILLITVIAFLVTAAFAFITLPVEFDASNRALAWLQSSGIARGAEYEGASDALKWAGMTYVASALSALLMVLYLLSRYMAADRR
ncbi:MAG: zinc metallopeptidase [Bacteroidetes bacterium]|nr:MAG: zinc metallopeptidase [Bacteroidota bacterium]